MTKTATAAKTRPEDWRPELKVAHAFRLRNDTWEDVGDAVDAGTARDKTEWAKEAIEARLGYVLCDKGRCEARVPLRFGNLGGGTLDPWVALAVRTVRGQDCRAHEPVTVGMDT